MPNHDDNQELGQDDDNQASDGGVAETDGDDPNGVNPESDPPTDGADVDFADTDEDADAEDADGSADEADAGEETDGEEADARAVDLEDVAEEAESDEAADADTGFAFADDDEDSVGSETADELFGDGTDDADTTAEDGFEALSPEERALRELTEDSDVLEELPGDLPDDVADEILGLPELYKGDGTATAVEGPPPKQRTTSVDRIREEVLDDVVEFFERLDVDRPSMPDEKPARRWLRSTSLAAEEEYPSEEFIREEWFEFDYLAGREEIERYWVNKPYSYVSLLYDPERKVYRYHVSEPVLSDFESYVKDDLTGVIRNNLMYEDIDEDTDREAVFAARVDDIIADHAKSVSTGPLRKLFYYFMRDFVGFGRIDPLMHDPALEDISCDGFDVPVFVYHRSYRDLRTNVSFESRQLNSLVVRLAQRAGKHISISNPLVDASLKDGSRVQLTLGTSVSARGSNFTIRKFAQEPITPVDLVAWNTFSIPQMAYFWLAIENNMSLVFAGGTGSGKTSSLNAVSFFIPPDSKVVSIEDTREVTLPHDNWVQGVTRQGVGASNIGEISTYHLLQASLRQRPEYLLVGEIRTEQRVALTFFQAIGTGHTAYTTIHADSLEAALARLENPPLSVPAQMIRNLDIISVQRQVFQEGDRVRRNERIGEVVPGDDADGVDTQTLFERDPATDTHERVGDSAVLERIATQRGWSADEAEAALAEREEVIQYMVDNDISDHESVATVIHTFARDPDVVLSGVRNDDLDPDALGGSD